MRGIYKCVRMRGAGDAWNILVCADAGSRGCMEHTSVYLQTSDSLKTECSKQKEEGSTEKILLVIG
jgi:hypothetical protein